MASASIIDALVKEFECSVCMDRLKNAKCLFCQHLFCRDCLEKSVQSGRDEANAITCPVCRVVTRLPRGSGVDGLKTNPLINNVLEKLSGWVDNHAQGGKARGRKIGERGGALGCHLCPCPIGDYFCDGCKVFLCFECIQVGAHDQSRILPRGEVDSEWETKRQACAHGSNTCKTHTKMAIEFHCSACDKLCCKICTRSEHKHHSTVPLHRKISSVNATMQNLVEQCHKKNLAIQTVHRDVNVNKEKAVDALRKLEVEIRDAAQKVVTKVSGKERELLRRLEAMTTTVEEEMGQKQTRCRELEGGFQAAVEAWEDLKHSGNDVEIVTKEGSIQTRMKDLIKSSIAPNSELTGVLQKEGCIQFAPGDLYLEMIKGGTLGELQEGRLWDIKMMFTPSGTVSQLMYMTDGRLVIGNVSDGIQVMDSGSRERFVTNFLLDESIRDLTVLTNNDVVCQDKYNEVYLMKELQADKIADENLGEFDGQWVSVSSFVREGKPLIAVYVAARFFPDSQKVIIMDRHGKEVERYPMSHHHGVRNVTFDRNGRILFIDFDRKGVHWPDLRGGGPERLRIMEEGREYLAVACNQSTYVYVASQDVTAPNMITITKHSLSDGRLIGTILRDHIVRSSYHLKMANWKDEEISISCGGKIEILLSKKSTQATRVLDRF